MHDDSYLKASDEEYHLMRICIYRSNYFIPSNNMQIFHQMFYIYLLLPYNEHVGHVRSPYKEHVWHHTKNTYGNGEGKLFKRATSSVCIQSPLSNPGMMNRKIAAFFVVVLAVLVTDANPAGLPPPPPMPPLPRQGKHNIILQSKIVLCFPSILTF